MIEDLVIQCDLSPEVHAVGFRSHAPALAMSRGFGITPPCTLLIQRMRLFDKRPIRIGRFDSLRENLIKLIQFGYQFVIALEP